LAPPAGRGVLRKVEINEVMDRDYETRRPEPRAVIVHVKGIAAIAAREPRIDELDADVRLVDGDPSVDEVGTREEARRQLRVEAIQQVLVSRGQVWQQIEPHGGGPLGRPIQDMNVDPDPHAQLRPGLS